MGRSYARQLELKLAFEGWRKVHCKTCVNSMYCIITNEGDSDKAVCIYKGRKSDSLIVSCENFKSRYIGKILDL